MTEDEAGARVTIRKRSNSGEGAAIGGAEPVRGDAAPGREREEGTLVAVSFHLVPLPRHDNSVSTMSWAVERIREFFGRAPSIDLESGALHVHEGPWPAPAALAAFADELLVEAERMGYRCTCESTLRW